MRIKISLIIIFVIFSYSSFLSIAANESPAIILRSGTIDDDDIEEALSINVIKYSGVLNISNNILDLFTNLQYNEIYTKYFDNELKNIFSLKELIAFNESIKNKFGKFISYKQQQWYFVFTKENGKDILISAKIVHHEKAIIYYRFTFFPHYLEKLVGFQIQIKKLLNTNNLPGV